MPHLVKRVHEVITDVRWGAGANVIERGTKPINIAANICTLGLIGLFGSHVAGCPQYHPGNRKLHTWIAIRGQAKICQQGRVVRLAHEDIRRFDVAVDYTLTVRGRQATSDLT